MSQRGCRSPWDALSGIGRSIRTPATSMSAPNPIKSSDCGSRAFTAVPTSAAGMPAALTAAATGQSTPPRRRGTTAVDAEAIAMTRDAVMASATGTPTRPTSAGTEMIPPPAPTSPMTAPTTTPRAMTRKITSDAHVGGARPLLLRKVDDGRWHDGDALRQLVLLDTFTFHAVAACRDVDHASESVGEVLVETCAADKSRNGRPLHHHADACFRKSVARIASNSQCAGDHPGVRAEGVDQKHVLLAHDCTDRPDSIQADVPPATFTARMPADASASHALALRRPDWQIT